MADETKIVGEFVDDDNSELSEEIEVGPGGTKITMKEGGKATRVFNSREEYVDFWRKEALARETPEQRKEREAKEKELAKIKVFLDGEGPGACPFCPPLSSSFFSDEDLRKLAADIAGNLVFHSNMVRNPSELPMIFMVLGLMDQEGRESWMSRRPGLMYEYYAAAAPRSVNGYPTFFSVRSVPQPQMKTLAEYTNAIMDAQAGFRSGKPQ